VSVEPEPLFLLLRFGGGLDYGAGKDLSTHSLQAGYPPTLEEVRIFRVSGFQAPHLRDGGTHLKRIEKLRFESKYFLDWFNIFVFAEIGLIKFHP
jgi:hypothetical protein